MKKATTPRAAAQTKDGAKVQKTTEPRKGGMYIGIIITQADPDPLDWNELDSFSRKPPTHERRPRKAAYNKPALVKKFEAVTGNTYRDDTANGLTRCIIAYLKYKGWQAERVNTTGIPIDRRREVTDVLGHTRTIGSLTWRPSGSTVGSADISATIDGKSVKIEVKIGKDRQSEAQRAYQQQVEQAGGIYYIARDFTSFWQWFQNNFTKGGAR